MAEKTKSDRKHDLVLTRIFDAPLEQVWRAWVEPEMVRQWWGPTGFTCILAKIDFREGGASLVGMRASEEFGGGEFYNTWTYRKIKPLQEFEYIQRFTNRDGQAFDPAEVGFPADVPKEVRNVNVFKDLGDGRTELTVTEYGYPSEQARDLSRLGLEQCLDKMAAIFSGAKTAHARS
ncbi:MAG TPA: SRPBCC domain-containing protein [Anaerolineales bacterium]|nr:SRPBCC domain-containing protein [Anaerolineales bacterium]